MLCDEATRNNAEPSSAGDQQLWRAIWKVPVPNCVRNFLWRLARNILPTRGNLKEKGVEVEPLCLLCYEMEEDQEHLFMLCQATRALWFTSQLGIHVPQQTSLTNWMKQWLSCPDVEAQQIFSVTLWRTWKARNQAVFNNAPFKPMDIAAAVSDFVQEFNNANGRRRKPRKDPQTLKWEAPDPETIKINIDAGCFENRTTGMGMNFRNHEGSVWFAATKFEKVNVSPILAETLCLRWCLQWVKEQNFEKIVIETDAEVIVKCLQGCTNLAAIGPIILDCKDLLAQMLNLLEI